MEDERKCYSYRYKYKGSKGEHCGWIPADSEEDAFVELCLRFGQGKLEFEVTALGETGTWADFIKQGDRYGWD